jgi:hypothetical protein
MSVKYLFFSVVDFELHLKKRREIEREKERRFSYRLNRNSRRCVIDIS